MRRYEKGIGDFASIIKRRLAKSSSDFAHVRHLPACDICPHATFAHATLPTCDIAHMRHLPTCDIAHMRYCPQPCTHQQIPVQIQPAPTCSSDPTSSHATSGVVVNPSRRTDGCTCRTASSKSLPVMTHPSSWAGVSGALPTFHGRTASVVSACDVEGGSLVCSAADSSDLLQRG